MINPTHNQITNVVRSKWRSRITFVGFAFLQVKVSFNDFHQQSFDFPLMRMAFAGCIFTKRLFKRVDEVNGYGSLQDGERL